MLLLGKTYQINKTMTVGYLVLFYLSREMQGYTKELEPSAETLDALADEIWQATENKHLRRSSPENTRGHDSQRGPMRSSTLFVYPDEFVYLPLLDGGPGMRPTKIGVDASSAEDASKTIQLWLEESEETEGFQGEVQHVSPEHLKGYVLNSALRQGKQAHEVYFFLDKDHVALVDAAPTTAAGGATPNTASATPAWFLPFWGYIDRLKVAADNHIALYNRLIDTVAQGRGLVSLLRSVEQFMTLMEDKLKPPPPPTGLFDKVIKSVADGQMGGADLPQDIRKVHAALKSLLTVANQELVEKPPGPETNAFQQSATALAALQYEPKLAECYESFYRDRQRFVLTERAYMGAVTSYVTAMALTLESEAATQAAFKAFLEGAAGPTPITEEIAAIFEGRSTKEYLGDAFSAPMSLAGNAPGPMTLWVALTKLSLLDEIRKISVLSGGSRNPQKKNAVTLKRYLDRLAKVSGFDDASLKALEKQQVAQPYGAGPKAVARRIAALTEAADQTQSGPGFMKLLSIMNLLLIINSGVTTAEDLAKLVSDPQNVLKHAIGVASDFAGVASAGIGLSADVLSLVAQSPKAAASVISCARSAAALGAAVPVDKVAAIVNNAKVLTAVVGKWAAGAGAVVGVFQIVQGAMGNEKGEVDQAKIWQGAGSVMWSAGYFIDLYVSRLGPRFLVRVGLTDIGSMALGEGALLMLGSFLTVAGILITLAAILYTNREPLMRLIDQLTTPGTQKFVEAILTTIKGCKVVKTAAPSVTAAIDSALAASKASLYVSWAVPWGGVAELKAIGFSDEDIKIIQIPGVQLKPGVLLRPAG